MTEESFENPYANSAEIAAEVKRLVVRKMAKPPKSRLIAAGRRCALMALDVLMSKNENIQKVYDAMQERLDADPVEFYKTIVEPLMPKSAISGDDDLSEDKMGTQQGSTVIVLPPNGREPVIVRPDGDDHA